MTISKLLIIGNGFDLSCGLKSSYNDFFNWQLETSTAFVAFYVAKTGLLPPSTKTSGGTYIVPQMPAVKVPTEELTLWDMYFISLKRDDPSFTENWCDIEKAIQNSLLGQEHFWGKTYETISTAFNAYNNRQQPAIVAGEIEHYVWQYAFNKKAPYNDRYFGVYTEKIEFSRDEFYSLLLDQLELFENKFRKYISQQVDTGRGYSSDALTLTQKLLAFRNNESATYNVVNFNFTNPFTLFDENSGHKFISDNVHGSIASEYSIFGIDSEIRKQDGSLLKVNQSDPAYSFTKQRRRIVKMAEGKESPGVTNSQYKELIFYGHSLNEQDYSYFHTLFDLCDLYGSELRLLFYYKKYGKTAEDNKKIQDARITEMLALLGRYGETLSNKSHGANLIDKLYNERRLLIKAI